MTAPSWQLDMGAQVLESGRVRFRVWAPEARTVELEVYPWPEGVALHAMERDDDGFWSAQVEAAPGTLYRYRLDGSWSYPDPCSRSQPEGVHGPSEVIDNGAFQWTDTDWRGPDPDTLVIYECHVGTYTADGTLDALIGQLDELAGLGITALELMPVAEFAGRWNWGYDGVDLFAPSHVYGGPEALQRLVDAAHARGLAVILDVVFNHLGPEGNCLRAFSPYYFTDRHRTPWGDAINFDGAHCRWVRHFFVQNALYWLHEYHIDGLRLDAAHQMHDAGPKHILRELAEAVHERGLPGHSFLLVAEDDQHDLRLIAPAERAGYGLDGLWVDDFHHSVHVLLTEEDRIYLHAYQGTAEEIARLLRAGLLYFKAPPSGGASEATPADRLVYCLQNHDQVGNRPHGRRLVHLVEREPLKAAAALLLLTPCIPMIFMGTEFASSKPFFYFADHSHALAEQVREGRSEAFRDFWATLDPARYPMPDPHVEGTFLQSRLDLGERTRPGHDGVYRLYRELLRLRASDPVLRTQARHRLLAEAPAPMLVALARWDDDGRRRLLLVNFGAARSFDLRAQSWLGDAAALAWRPLLATAEERFAGPGVDLSTLALTAGPVELPSRCAVLWAAGPG